MEIIFSLKFIAWNIEIKILTIWAQFKLFKEPRLKMFEKLESYIERMNIYKRKTTKCVTSKGCLLILRIRLFFLHFPLYFLYVINYRRQLGKI